MTVIELIIAFVLGFLTMLCALWISGAKKKLAVLSCANSLGAAAVLFVVSLCFDTALKLNAFSLYLSALLGFGGIGIIYLINTVL